jgi:flavin reductase (DIM6/NTAB) family NADH-FMN oxidoreductase RutF
MDLLIEELSTQERYKFLSAVVIPRPVALVTSKDQSGLCTAAPFSFFNVFSDDPAIAILGIGAKSNGGSKDTLQNIRDVKEFVINMVDSSIIGAMHIASAELPSNESEIDYAGVTLINSQTVGVQRIAEAPASLECELFQIMDLTERRALVLGRIKAIHIKDDLIDPITKRIIPEKYSPIARLFGDHYAWLGERYTKAIPSVEEIQRLGLRAGEIKADS